MGNTSPLAVTTPSGPNTPSISAALSGLSLGGGNSGVLKTGSSGLLMTSDTIAPCLKGANKNKALVREVCGCPPGRSGCFDTLSYDLFTAFLGSKHV